MNQEEIRFWRKAIKKIKEDYGSGCKKYSKNCMECEAALLIKFIHRHIKILEMEK